MAAELPAGAFARVLAVAADVAAARRAGVNARAEDARDSTAAPAARGGSTAASAARGDSTAATAAGDDSTAATAARSDSTAAPASRGKGNALAAAPLIAVAEFFGHAAQGTMALACAGDEGGAATAAALLAG